MRLGAGFLHFFSRQKRFLAGSIITLQNKMVNMRLLWTLQNVPGLIEEAKKGNVMFGTLDTWLVYKLTKGKVYVTDIGSVSATGRFNNLNIN